LAGATFYNLLEPSRTANADRFGGKQVVAIAGIGNPDRFFTHLRDLGIRFGAQPFPDHHRFEARDLLAPGAEIVLMTEKDAIKCEGLADDRMWVLPVVAEVSDALVPLVVACISRGHRNGDRLPGPG
jgi:tetraacyldisaccharide 4'-kinase